LEDGYGITDIVEDIIGILDQLSMNHLPREVEMFVKHCNITTHQYNQRTLIGASDSLLGFRVKHFGNMNIYNYHNPEWDNWIARQQKTEPEPAAATYTSLDNKEDGYDDNSISNALHCHVKLRLQKEFQKARKDWEDYNDYDSLDVSKQHKSKKRKAHLITYYDDDHDDADDDEAGSNVSIPLSIIPTTYQRLPLPTCYSL